MKKKVFFIMSTNDFSGAENVNFSIIDNLRCNYDFYWVSTKGKINDFLVERKINWIEIKRLSIKEIKRVIIENKPDILHTTDFRASFITALCSPKCKLIFHLHNNWPWLKKPGIKSIAFLLAGLKANTILTVSPSIQKEFIFSKILQKKIECIGNPVNTQSIFKHLKNKEVKKKYDICCVARLTEQKNPFKFIKIIKALKCQRTDISAVWVGKGELLEEVCKRVKEEKLERNIKFVGFQKNPYKYMAESKIFLLTSDWEGYGLVAVEALTLGLPCVVSNVGGLPNIVDNFCGKLCINNNEFIDEAQTLLEDNKYYQVKSKEARNKAKKLNNINEYIKNIDSLYK